MLLQAAVPGILRVRCTCRTWGPAEDTELRTASMVIRRLCSPTATSPHDSSLGQGALRGLLYEPFQVIAQHSQPCGLRNALNSRSVKLVRCSNSARITHSNSCLDFRSPGSLLNTSSLQTDCGEHSATIPLLTLTPPHARRPRPSPARTRRCSAFSGLGVAGDVGKHGSFVMSYQDHVSAASGRKTSLQKRTFCKFEEAEDFLLLPPQIAWIYPRSLWPHSNRDCRTGLQERLLEVVILLRHKREFMYLC